ncbi:hypothetical protein GF325_09770 [Candidatus Bathyarchaeota archaeon]|nr:hypothetical protein [Candidatus Bathyarchaeota archaeon]
MVKRIAYFDASHDFPEQIAMAAGLEPYKILGNVHEPNDPADQYLQSFLCPAARSMLTEALTGDQDWEGIVIAHGCDATNRFYDIWKRHVDTDFLYWFYNPLNDTPSAINFFKVELKRMKDVFERQFDVSITDDKLWAAIKLSNDIKGRLQELSTMRAVKDIPNRDYFNACVQAVQMPRKELLSSLDETINDWKGRDAFPADKSPVLLTGSDVTYVEWMDTLDDAGLRVVRDDLSIGERYFARLIPHPSEGDPLDSIIQYHVTIPRPATKNPPEPRLDYLMNAMEESNLNMVISQNLKFCEPYAFDSVFTVNALKEKGYQVIHLEREFSPTKDMSLRTRLEAFREMATTNRVEKHSRL